MLSILMPIRKDSVLLTDLARQVLLVLLLERRLLVVLGLFVVMLTFQFLVYAIQGLVGE